MHDYGQTRGNSAYIRISTYEGRRIHRAPNATQTWYLGASRRFAPLYPSVGHVEHALSVRHCAGVGGRLLASGTRRRRGQSLVQAPFYVSTDFLPKGRLIPLNEACSKPILHNPEQVCADAPERLQLGPHVPSSCRRRSSDWVRVCRWNSRTIVRDWSVA